MILSSLRTLILISLANSWKLSVAFSVSSLSSNSHLTTSKGRNKRRSHRIVSNITELFMAGDNDSNTKSSLRFLGKGENAVIRPGVVLIAPNHEYNHFLMRSAVFIHAMGINEYDEHVTRGVILDHPTAFNMGEMGGGSVHGNLAHSLLFQGGDTGNDSCMLLHSAGSGCNNDANGHIECCSNEESDQKIDCGDMIGSSGIYEGGLYHAMDLVDDGTIGSTEFKFFFNFIEFTDVELEGMMSATDTDGDAWVSMEVPTGVVLNNDYGRGECWSYLRNQMKQMMMK